MMEDVPGKDVYKSITDALKGDTDKDELIVVRDDAEAVIKGRLKEKSMFKYTRPSKRASRLKRRARTRASNKVARASRKKNRR